MAGNKSKFLGLEWNARKFITRFDLTDSTDGESDAQRQSNIKGWSTVQTIEVEMNFITADLKTAAGG